MDEREVTDDRGEDRLRMQGYVTVYQGEGKDKIILFDDVPNKWVDKGLKGLLSAFLGRACSVKADFWTTGMQIYIGTDTGTATGHANTALQTPIGGAPGTAPNTMTGEDRTNPSSGVWETKYIAIWNAGAVSGTVGEIAMYMRAFDNITAQWYNDLPGWTPALVMVSRVSVADSEIDAFSIDVSKSLTIQWTVRVSYE